MTRIITAVLLLFIGYPLSFAAEHFATVSAGEFDRRDTVVSFTLPESALKKNWTMADDAGAAVAIQQDSAGQVWFILGELKAGQSRAYTLREGNAAIAPAVEAIRQERALKLLVDKREVLRYQAEKSDTPEGYDAALQRGGYVHPVLTPSGKQVTDDYPPNHKHHHGIWAPWTKTEFEGRHPDFWNMGAKTGAVEFVAIDGTWSGPVHGGFKTRHRFVDLSATPEPKAALNETWEVVLYRVGTGAKRYWMFDLAITQECASPSALSLPKYFYGGLGFRGNRQWDGKPNCFYLTSEGKDRSNGNETTGRWCHIGGKVNGELAGVAVLGHPDNFRAPQPMRLHPSEPFFCFAPSQGGDWKIEPGKPYHARYRFIVADGGPDKAELDRLWNDFAAPPKVEVK